MRAFIFSLDSFVAFTLALVAIYSLIFFASIPSSYYYLLTQGHFLARDVLFSVSTSDCISPPLSCSSVAGGSVLDNIVFSQNMPEAEVNIQNSIGKAIPPQFGYKLEVSKDDGQTWVPYYDTNRQGEKHAKEMKKLSVSSHLPVFEYARTIQKEINPYLYRSCMGDGTDFVITCQDPSSGPQALGPDDIVPEAGVRLVRLTIFI